MAEETSKETRCDLCGGINTPDHNCFKFTPWPIELKKPKGAEKENQAQSK